MIQKTLAQSLLDNLVHRLFQDNEPSTEPPLTTVDLNVLREEQPGPSGIAQVEQPPSKKKKASSIMKTTKTRWTWDDHKIESSISNLIEYKLSQSFEGLDFEADLVSLYSNIRVKTLVQNSLTSWRQRN